MANAIAREPAAVLSPDLAAGNLSSYCGRLPGLLRIKRIVAVANLATALIFPLLAAGLLVSVSPATAEALLIAPRGLAMAGSNFARPRLGFINRRL
jgi:hypothetical protein